MRLLCLVLLTALISPALLIAQKNPDITQAITQIQDVIASADFSGTGYYATTYRKSEVSYWEKIPGWMQQDAASRKVQRILDIGCGYGTLLALSTQIYGASGYCMDASEYLLPPVRKKFSLEFQRGNVELDPISWREPFEVIQMTEVLEHFNFYPVTTLKKIREWLADDGLFFLSTPDASKWGKVTKYYKRLQDMPPPTPGKPFIDAHIWQYSKDELEGVLREAGFKIERLEYSGSPRHFNMVLKKASR